MDISDFTNVKSIYSSTWQKNIIKIQHDNVVLWRDESIFTPFWIENTSGEDGTITISQLYYDAPIFTIEKSIDMVTWASVGSTSTTLSIPISAGSKVYLRANTHSWGYFDADEREDGYNIIRCNKSHKIGGNIHSLLFGTSFNGQTSMYRQGFIANDIFSYLFYNNTNLIDASDLLLLTQFTSTYSGGGRCYYNMFRGCISLTTAPELPSLIIPLSGYNEMFRGCSKLNYVKCLATSNLTGSCSNWLNGVALSGTFIKNSAATWALSGDSGIPSGWTVEDAA